MMTILAGLAPSKVHTKYRKISGTDKIRIEIGHGKLYSILNSVSITSLGGYSFEFVCKTELIFIPINIRIHAAMPLSVHGFWCTQEENMAALSDLTPRELEILHLVLAGRTNKAIAAEICVSEKTVEFHLDKIYTKIGMRTRMLAGMWAIQQGISANKTREIPS
jgi:DNA-binding CsgD family transcriptional regulator